jgi:hypothetical protein
MRDLQTLLENAGVRPIADDRNALSGFDSNDGGSDWDSWEQAAANNVDRHLGDMGIEDPEEAAAEAYNLAHDGAMDAGAAPEDASQIALDISRGYGSINEATGEDQTDFERAYKLFQKAFQEMYIELRDIENAMADAFLETSEEMWDMLDSERDSGHNSDIPDHRSDMEDDSSAWDGRA